MATKEDQEWCRAIEEHMAKLDANSWRKRLELERKKGYEEGFKEGLVIRDIHFRQRLLKQPMTPVEELSELSIQEMRAMTEALVKQYGASGSQAPPAA